MQPSVPSSKGDPVPAGLAFAAGAFVIWGLSPIYFKAVGSVGALEVLAHRVVWSAALTAGLLAALGRLPAVWLALATPRLVRVFALSTVLISINWGLYIWSVANDHIVQVSLGYYINPIVNVLLGMVFLAERLNRRQALAVALAALGVIGLIVSHGVVPWISLTLACSFGVYALVRKKAGADPLVGFFCETVLLAPIAAGYLIWLGATGRGAFLAGTAGFDLLLLAAGLITAVPLILYMHGAQRLRLSTIGLMQYTAPTIQLALGVLVYGEAFTPAHAFAFACIWVALAIYSTDAWRSRRAARPEGAAAEA